MAVANDDPEIAELDERLDRHMAAIERCTLDSDEFGPLLLATPAENRYPYVYPRDCASACQLFRRLAGSKNGYGCGPRAFELLRSTARFMRAVQPEAGCWGQRYAVDGEDKSIYRQEDNGAHGIGILCNYLLTADYLGEEIEDREGWLKAIGRGLRCALDDLYQPELNLFESTTAIHESALEKGYTLWVNFAYLYAFRLANEVAEKHDDEGIIDDRCLEFHEHFLHSVSELFMEGRRYVRRIDETGRWDSRPDVTLLSPFYFGFLHYEDEMVRSVEFLEKHLWDPELGLIMRYLPFRDDPATHIHAGNGPWLQYSAVLAQFRFWNGDRERGDEILERIDSYANAEGEIPEHVSTCRRFEEFMEEEWRTGRDFDKEFDRTILLDGLPFDLILEEAVNMQRSYEETSERCMFVDETATEGGFIQFATPLMWSHAEYARALLLRAGDWWEMWR